MSGLKSDCRKFSPNVFNKTKCQNCFRTKESHSAEALENNRASRNVSKCGYLFVAPDWDFNVSVNRTKRWQRRWFVLYDDGELTYALDEFPDTIPQGTIDMNKVLDVSDAEGITGNDFAISITTPEKVHFIKGTSKEESKWWFDVLCRVSPRHLSRVKHKRNATFPCGRATIPTTAVITQEYCSEDDMRLNSFSRPKFLSTSQMAQDWLLATNTEEDEDVFTTKDDTAYIIGTESNNKIKRDVEVHNALNKLISLPEDILNESEKDINSEDPTEQRSPKDYLSELEESENRRRNRRYLKRENRIQRSQRSRNDGVSKMIPSKSPNKNSSTDSSSSSQSPNVSAIAAAEKLEYLESIHTKSDKLCSVQKDTVGETETISESPVPRNEKNPSGKTNLRKSESLKNIPTETESEIKDHVSGLRRYHSFKGSSSHRKLKPSSGTSSLKRTKSSSTGLPKATSTPISTKPVTLNTSYNSSSGISQLLDISDENIKEGTFTRTGWLMRQTLTKDWSKHWFVLKDSSLTYYRDPSAEHCGIMDGILDLNQVSTIREQDSDRFYAISLRMWDGKKHVLAAETEEFRCMWMQALQYASNLWSSASKEDFICTEIILPEHTFHQSDRTERISSPSSLVSLSYAEESQHAVETSSYSSDDQSEYFSLVDEDEISDLSSSPRTLPPSPPINRNVISLVKEKSRTRCNYGSKTNSSPNSCGGTTCEYDSHKNMENQLNRDFCNKYQGSPTPVPMDEDSDVAFLDDQLVNGDDRPTSPITPPIEFMNASQNGLIKSEHTNSESVKGEYCRSFGISGNQTVFRESKITDPEECSMCLSVRSKLLLAQEEIRKLEKELKEAHANFDNLEMFSYKLTQDMKLKEENYNSQIALMTAKIDDLTSKFTFAEKNYRQLKQKALKSEGKERRRSSLKNREGLSLTKEYETKLCELEKKINSIETSVKSEPSEIDESERSLSESSFKMSESYVATASESSETSTPAESTVSESKGLFSRLQSLMSKVENVNSLFSLKDDSVKTANPKILLEVKNNEELSSLDESDEWQTQSSNDTQTNSNNSVQYPKNLSECQIMLHQKLNSHFEWLKHSLDLICEHEKDESYTQNEQLMLVNNLTRELNELHQEIDPNSLTEPKFLLLFELTKILEKINCTDNVGSLLKINATKGSFKTIFQTMCIAFAEYENKDFSDMLISSIPEFQFFCPSACKLSPETLVNPSHVHNISERLQSLESQSEDILNSLSQAKLIRYEELWNILAEVPVQDDHINKPVEITSVLNCTTSIATDIHQIAELQLSNVPKLSPYMSKLELTGIQEWRENSSKTLKENLTSFLNELKGKCPMIIESTVSFYKLNEAIRNDIIRLVVELSFLSICGSLLRVLTVYFTRVNQMDLKLDQRNFSLQEKWLYFLKKTPCLMNVPPEDIFQCSQCTILNNLFYDSGEHINWVDFVKTYNGCNVRKAKKYLKADSEIPQNSSINSCANCESKFSGLQGKNQKDACNNVTCAQCDSWIQKFCTSEKQHELEQRTLELKHNAELKQLEECIIKSSEIHEQEMLQKQNELIAVTAQLQRLKNEYEDQKQMLKNFYEEKLNFEYENIDEDSIKDVYRMEIEDLKDMFKKGLIAIENSHNRITSEMERRHSEEIALLEAEKRRELEVEAQATFTALEAIKKSHVQQLREETALIKEDLINKFQRGEECENLYSKYGNELEKLKSEIMKITEMYSSKCIENVALEEKVNSLRQQLKEAHNELCNLLTKNKEINISLCGK